MKKTENRIHSNWLPVAGNNARTNRQYNNVLKMCGYVKREYLYKPVLLDNGDLVRIPYMVRFYAYK